MDFSGPSANARALCWWYLLHPPHLTAISSERRQELFYWAFPDKEMHFYTLLSLHCHWPSNSLSYGTARMEEGSNPTSLKPVIFFYFLFFFIETVFSLTKIPTFMYVSLRFSCSEAHCTGRSAPSAAPSDLSYTFMLSRVTSLCSATYCHCIHVHWIRSKLLVVCGQIYVGY
jgi:hypothetical protein